jgi:hypothetical protein
MHSLGEGSVNLKSNWSLEYTKIYWSFIFWEGEKPSGVVERVYFLPEVDRAGCPPIRHCFRCDKH